MMESDWGDEDDVGLSGGGYDELLKKTVRLAFLRELENSFLPMFNIQTCCLLLNLFLKME